MITLQPLASWQNIGKLLLREWFQRVWITQEVVAGSKVSISAQVTLGDIYLCHD